MNSLYSYFENVINENKLVQSYLIGNTKFDDIKEELFKVFNSFFFKNNKNLEENPDLYILKKEDGIVSKEDIKDLLKKILVKDPDSRPKIETIKASSFFNSGKGIPKFLPESTTKKSLTRDEEEEYVNNAIIKGECLDKDFDLPDRTANKRYSYTSYTERNEMESNIDHEELSMRDEEYDDYDKNDNIMNNNNYNNNNVFMNRIKNR